MRQNNAYRFFTAHNAEDLRDWHLALERTRALALQCVTESADSEAESKLPAPASFYDHATQTDLWLALVPVAGVLVLHRAL